MNNDRFQHGIPIQMWIKNTQKSQTVSEFSEFSTFSTHPTTTTITTIIYPSFLISAPPDGVNKTDQTAVRVTLVVLINRKKEEMQQEILHEIHYK